MNNSLKAVHRLQAHLAKIKAKVHSERSAIALKRDTQYLEKCETVISEGGADGINDLWREVQHLSRYFGEGYAEGDDQDELVSLMDGFESALLEDVSVIRSR